MKGAREILTGTSAVVHAVITGTKGSSPREAGAEMFVTASALCGTIGGGQVEWQAIAKAREMLVAGALRETVEIVLGPDIGQCCGGRITVKFERLGETQRAAHLARLDAVAMPHLLILGAGHVGRALARVALTLPWRVIVADPRATELALLPGRAEPRLTPLPEAEIASAPAASAYVITTHDHGLDFLLTLAALRRNDAAYVGLIGSATKRNRFERFARETGHVPTAQLVCPIGAAGLGDKRPEVIALMTAQEIHVAFQDADCTIPTSCTHPASASGLV